MRTYLPVQPRSILVRPLPLAERTESGIVLDHGLVLSMPLKKMVDGLDKTEQADSPVTKRYSFPPTRAEVVALGRLVHEVNVGDEVVLVDYSIDESWRVDDDLYVTHVDNALLAC